MKILLLMFVCTLCLNVKADPGSGTYLLLACRQPQLIDTGYVAKLFHSPNNQFQIEVAQVTTSGLKIIARLDVEENIEMPGTVIYSGNGVELIIKSDSEFDWELDARLIFQSENAYNLNEEFKCKVLKE